MFSAVKNRELRKLLFSAVKATTERDIEFKSHEIQLMSYLTDLFISLLELNEYQLL